MSELNEEVRVTVDDAPVATVPLVENFTADNAAPKASFVGSALAGKADIATIMNYVTISVDGQESDNQGVILLYGDDIPVDDTNNAPSVKAAIQAVDAKTASNISYGLNVSIKDKIDEVAAEVDALDEKTAADIVYADTTTIKTKVDAIESTLGTVQTAAASAVKVAAQTLTDAEKLQARTNIGAAAAAEAVSVNSQSFTSSQQAQARANIGALGAADAVLVDAQTLTTSQQAQARANIGALSAADVADVVRTSEQTLTDAQKTQARTNIGAMGSGALAGMLKFSSYSYALPSGTPAGGVLTITQTELGVTPPDGYSLVGILRFAIGDTSYCMTSMSASSIGNIYIQLINRSSSATSSSSNFNVQLLWVKGEFLA